MALVSLSPWPTDAHEATDAGNCLVAAVAEATIEKARRVGPVASEIVENYAPGAPQSVRNEAVVRLAAWIISTPAQALRSGSAGPLAASYSDRRAVGGALRNSGAMGLLAAFRNHGAVAL